MNKKQLRELLHKLDPESLQMVLEFVNCLAQSQSHRRERDAKASPRVRKTTAKRGKS